MNEDSNRPSSQSERSFEHPFHYVRCLHSVSPRVFFFYLSNPFYLIYVWSAKTTLKSLSTNSENVNETGIATGASASFSADGTAAIDSAPRSRPDMICLGVLADYATGLTCTSDNESWVQTTSGAAHDLPWGSGSHRTSVPGSGGADGTLRKLRFIRENVNVHFHLVRNRDPSDQSDGDGASTPLLEENEAHRAPSPLIVSKTFGLLKGKGMRGTCIQKSHQDG